MTTALRARVEATDGVATVSLEGDVNGDAREALERAYDEAAQTAAGTLLLDFTRVEYINSTGIALIVGLLARARADGTGVEACGLTHHYQEIFEITRLSDFMTIHPGEAPARTEAKGGTA